MAKRSRKDPKVDASPSAGAPFNDALAQLAALRAQMGDAPPEEPSPEPVADASQEQAYVLKGKIVVRKEKKGRAGKTATRVSNLNLDADALGVLAKDMKRQLGCGAVVEDGDLVLLGDLTSRAAEWLRSRGAKKVVGD